MSTTSTDVGGFAPGHKITHPDGDGGVVYEFRYLDDAVLAEYERARFEVERTKLREFVSDYTRSEYVQRLDQLYQAYRHNEFAMDCDKQYRESAEGKLFLLGLLIRVEGKAVALKDLAKLFMERRDEVALLMMTVMAESVGTTPEKLKEMADKAEEEAAQEKAKGNGEHAVKKGIPSKTEIKGPPIGAS